MSDPRKVREYLNSNGWVVVMCRDAKTTKELQVDTVFPAEYDDVAILVNHVLPPTEFGNSERYIVEKDGHIKGAPDQVRLVIPQVFTEDNVKPGMRVVHREGKHFPRKVVMNEITDEYFLAEGCYLMTKGRNLKEFVKLLNAHYYMVDPNA